MIIKYQTETNAGPAWAYFDDVEDVEVLQNTCYAKTEEGMKELAHDLFPMSHVVTFDGKNAMSSEGIPFRIITFWDGESTFALASTDTVYLLNDNGKTIERI